MRGSDYVLKRVAFALVTVFVAITLNFILFRTLPGDAIQALRCRQCTEQFKEALREDLGLDKSKWEQYKLYITDLAQGDFGDSLRTQTSVRAALGAAQEHRPMVALGYVFSIVIGSSSE